MDGHGVIHRHVDGIGLVDADIEVGFSAQNIDQGGRHAPVAMGDDADLPRARAGIGAEQVGAAVHGEQGGLAARSLAQVQGLVDGGLVRVQNLALAGKNVGLGQIGIAGNRGAVAGQGDGLRHAGTAVAVDHQAGIGLKDIGGIQIAGEARRHAIDADVMAEMARHLGLVQTQSAEASWHRAPRMVRGKQDRSPPAGILDPKCGRVVGAKKSRFGGHVAAPLYISKPACWCWHLRGSAGRL